MTGKKTEDHIKNWKKKSVFVLKNQQIDNDEKLDIMSTKKRMMKDTKLFNTYIFMRHSSINAEGAPS